MKQASDKYINQLKETILSLIDRDKVFVFLFGSRAAGRGGPSADVDIGLWAPERLPENLYHKIRNAVDESIVPYEVDIVDFTRVNPTFKEVAVKDIKIWNQPKDMHLNWVL